MDPQANLKRQLEIAREIQLLSDQEAREDAPNDLTERLAELSEELGELVLALHEWRVAGGFDPYAA